MPRGGDKHDLSQAMLPGLHRDPRIPPAPPRSWDPLSQHFEPLPGDDHSRLHKGYNAGPPAHLTARANQLLKVSSVSIFILPQTANEICFNNIISS